MTAEAFMFHTLAHAPTVLRSARPVVTEMARAAITSFVLRQPTRHPDHPGLIRDHVATTDFEWTFTRIHDGTIEASIEGSPSVAGSA